MSDLVGNPEAQFSRVAAQYGLLYNVGTNVFEIGEIPIAATCNI